MTLVDADTGEVVEADVLSESQARRIVARINGTTAELIDLIEQAWRGQAWVALGYRSWDALCEAEIHVPRLDRDRRVEMVGALRSVGMSTRAIGSATGTSEPTVRRDLRAGASDDAPAEPTPEPEPKVTGTDGKQYPAARPAPEPTKPRRSPLPEAAQRAGWELRKAIERVERILADDRFPTHREQVAAGLRSHLSYVAEVMPDLIDAMHQSQED